MKILLCKGSGDQSPPWKMFLTRAEQKYLCLYVQDPVLRLAIFVRQNEPNL